MGFKSKKFQDPYFYEERLKTITFFDKVACYLHAINIISHEGVDIKLPRLSQSVQNVRTDWKNIQKRLCDPYSGRVSTTFSDGVWIFAVNHLELSTDNINKLMLELGDCKLVIASEGGDLMHAEMKLLRALKGMGKLKSGRVEIGSSKPCCLRCRDVLNNWRAAFTSYHSIPVAENKWDDPDVGVPGWKQHPQEMGLVS